MLAYLGVWDSSSSELEHTPLVLNNASCNLGRCGVLHWKQSGFPLLTAKEHIRSCAKGKELGNVDETFHQGIGRTTLVKKMIKGLTKES